MSSSPAPAVPATAARSSTAPSHPWPPAGRRPRPGGRRVRCCMLCNPPMPWLRSS